MDDIIKLAGEIVKAQASVRPMTKEEIVEMARDVAAGLRSVSESAAAPLPEAGALVVESQAAQQPAIEPKKSIKENAVICIECGKSCKSLGKHHLATHGLTPEEYKEKWGLGKGTSLVAKSLVKERRKKMQEMRLWERRGAGKGKRTEQGKTDAS